MWIKCSRFDLRRVFPVHPGKGVTVSPGKHLDFFVTSTEVKVLESDSGWEASIFRDRYAWCRSGFVAFFQTTPTNGHGWATDSKFASGVFVKSEEKKARGFARTLSSRKARSHAVNLWKLKGEEKRFHRLTDFSWAEIGGVSSRYTVCASGAGKSMEFCSIVC